MTSRSLALLAFLALCTHLGCATIERDRALHREEMLARAGFERKPAESPPQQSELRQLPSRKLVRVPRGDEMVYVYADAEYCDCLYAGNERAYEDFIAALTLEFAQNETQQIPFATPSPEEFARYEKLARESTLDTTSEASVDWRLWK